MNVSGILVVAAAGQMELVRRAIEGIDGVEVHYTDPPTGRLVATIEADSIPGEVERLRRVQALPHVVLAELVYHHFENDGDIASKHP